MATSIRCTRCGAVRVQPIARSGRPRLPKGWKVLHDQPYCGPCKSDVYALRSVVVPLAGPVDGTWADFRTALRAGWNASTACANWMTTELYARDVRRQPGETKLAGMPRTYLYPEARLLFPALPPRAIPAMEQEVHAQYRAHRYDLLWLRQATLPTHRYPYPLPIPRQAWALSRSGEAWHLSFPLGDRRWTVRLRGGAELRYRLHALRQIAAGDAVAGALALYQVPSHRGDHRPDGAHRETRVMVRIAAWFPREPQHDAAGVLLVRTDADHFLVAGSGRQQWTLNADQVRRWRMAYDRQRQRLVQDLKTGWHARDRRAGMLGRVAALAERQRRRIDAWTHLSSRQVVDHAVRRRVAAIYYDDQVQTFVRSYPWHDLRQHIQQKAERAGLTFECAASPEVAPESEDARACLVEAHIP